MLYYEDPVVKLYQGDIRTVAQQLEPVDLILTSPPY